MNEVERIDLAGDVASYAAQCGINQKMMQQCIPFASAAAVRNAFAKKPVKEEHVEPMQATVTLLKFMKQRGVLPCSPRSQTPAVIKLCAQFLHLKMRLIVVDDAFPGAADLDVSDEVLLNTLDQIAKYKVAEGS